LLNTSNLADATDPALFVGEAVSAPFSLLNTSNLAGTTDPGLFVGEAVSAPFAVLNTTNLDGTTDLALFVGEAVSPFFVVHNTATQSGQAQSDALRTPAAQQQSAAGAGLPGVAITTPAHEQTVFHGQTIDVGVDAVGDGLGAAELLVNGTVLARDEAAPYAFAFTAPGTVTELMLQASISDARGNRAVSSAVRLFAVPDPRTTVVGRLVDADGRPLGNQTVRVTVNGLRAEFFDFTAPLATLPDVTGRTLTRADHASAIDMRNPGRLFGADPYGFGMDPDYAARFSGYLRIDQAGEYTFQLAANEGARLVVGGVTVAQMPTGAGELQARSGSIQLPAGLIPIEVTCYQSVGDAELQLLYAPRGGELQPVRPEQLVTAIAELQAQTDAFGRFAIANVPANIPAIQLSSDQGHLSQQVTPVAGGIVDLGDVVVRRQ
jgi:hypothetical protein